jgi:hypothetical protein
VTYNISTAPPTVSSRATALPTELMAAVDASYEDFKQSKPEPARVVNGLPTHDDAVKLLGQIRRYALTKGLGVYAPASSAIKEDKGKFSLTFEARPKRKIKPGTPAPVATPAVSETGPV